MTPTKAKEETQPRTWRYPVRLLAKIQRIADRNRRTIKDQIIIMLEKSVDDAEALDQRKEGGDE